MIAVYNEIEAYPAQWLRNLIAAGHIAPGAVDQRSIVELRAEDVRGATQAHFFAGIGVWSAALRDADWPDDRPVWTGSCPCQPFSDAGRGRGVSDERHLWPEWFRIIRECQPPVIFGEQVASRAGLGWLDAVFADLEGEGYACAAADLPAAGVGAPHKRSRLFFVAYAQVSGPREGGGAARGMGNARGSRCSGAKVTRADRGNEGTFPEALGRRTAGRFQPERAGDARELVDTSGSRSGRDARAVPRAETQGQEEWLGARRLVDVPRSAGATRGFWSDADWLLCRDNKARPVEPFALEMADGTSSGVGCVRPEGAEKAEEAEKEKVTDGLQTMQPYSGAQEVHERIGGREEVQRTEVLQSIMHGYVDGRSNEGPERQERTTTVSENGQDGVRPVQPIRCASPCSSSRPEPTEQRTGEPHDVVRVLSSSFALAELRGDHRTTQAVLALLSSCNAEGLVLHPYFTRETLWRSLGEEIQGRILLGLEAFSVVRSFPLTRDNTHRNRSAKLKGYGNAIVRQAAAAFIRAAMRAA